VGLSLACLSLLVAAGNAHAAARAADREVLTDNVTPTSAKMPSAPGCVANRWLTQRLQ
jgi:hypothetical protein